MAISTTNTYASHLPVLRRLFQGAEIRTVLEFGGGLYSTPWFLKHLPPNGRLNTVERDPEWAEKVRTNDQRHVVSAVRSSTWDADLVFIDDGDSVAERIKTIRQAVKAKPKGLVVIHDFEHYRQEARFNNVVTFDQRTPWTGVMWNADSRHGGEWIHRLASGS
jgi:predicted O-methyltransferase YrrM